MIPDAALDKHVALLGMTGSGKTSVIKAAVVEPDLEAGRRVLIVTPKDDWWGLRLTKTGKGHGYDIPIFGGRHADYPLQVGDAALLAETYGTMKGSAVLCTSLLSHQDRAHWFADFAERLLMKNRGWLRVVIDEAHVYMPKQGAKGGGWVPRALHAGNELVSQGRSLGLRIVLGSQRSAKLHNDSLTQCSCLMAMRLMAPHDRQAVKDWIEDQADPVKGKEIITSLATLNDGQAWVWAPAARYLKQVQFPRPSTFDSSAAPDDDTDAEHRLPPINLDALKGKLATVEAKRKADDPKELKAENARLAAELKKAQAAKPDTIDPADLERATQRGFGDGFDKGFRDGWQSRAGSVERALASVDDDLESALASCLKSIPQRIPAKVIPTRVASALPKPASQAKSVPAQVDGFDTSQTRILRALAMWRSLGDNAPSRHKLAAAAGYRVGGRFSNVLGGLRSAGAIDYPQEGLVTLVVDGVQAYTDEEAARLLVGVLDASQRKLVWPLLRATEPWTRETLAEAASYEIGGRFNNVLGSLRTLAVVDYPSKGTVALSDWARQLLPGAM